MDRRPAGRRRRAALVPGRPARPVGLRRGGDGPRRRRRARPRPRGLPLARRSAAAGRLVGVGVPRRRRDRAGRREQPRRLPRRRRLAQLAGDRRRAAGRRAVAGRPARPRPGHPHAAARRGDRVGAAPGRDAGRHRPAHRVRQPLPGAALRRRARRAAGRPSAGLGAGRHRTRDGAARVPRGVRRPVEILDGLVLPVLGGAVTGRPPATGWPRTGTGSSSPASGRAASPTGRG